MTVYWMLMMLTRCISLNGLTDLDGDGRPNVCDEECQALGMVEDTDCDGDGVLDIEDAFPLVPLNGLTDTDNDGAPDECDTECQNLGMTSYNYDDNDGISDILDRYPLISIANFVDTDGDGAPDNCDMTCLFTGMDNDTDDDNDGVLDINDVYPLISIGQLPDTDGDGAPNICDLACLALGMQVDPDSDADGDGIDNSLDAFPDISLGGLLDTDKDGRPDVCDQLCRALGMTADNDDDNDGIEDALDAFPTISIGSLVDTDNDGAPDRCLGTCLTTGMIADTDDDNDGVSDMYDAYPTVGLGTLLDSDRDGLPDECDAVCIANGMIADVDDDNDGTPDATDVFPLDATKSALSDDDIAPVLIVPEDVYASATGEYTQIVLGDAVALDNLEDVQASVDNAGPFPTGETIVTWSVSDTAGNKTTAQQSVYIRPLAEIAKNARMADDEILTIPVRLSGESYFYPVVIPIYVEAEGVSLSSSVIEITSGTLGVVDVELSEEFTGDDFTVYLEEPVNAAMGMYNQIKVNVVSAAVPPKVSLVVTQADSVGRYISRTEDIVNLDLLISDVNGNHFVEWELPESIAQNTTFESLNRISFNPVTIEPGNYRTTAKVYDDGLPGESFSRTITVKISGFSKLLDQDDDGIPDLFDITVTPNTIELGGDTNLVAQAQAGIKLRLGNNATETGNNGIVLAERDLPVAEETRRFPLGLLDFEAELNIPGETLELIVPLASPIPANATYRKLIDGTWRDFVVDELNHIYSAPQQEDSSCPGVGSSLYSVGLIEGNRCLLLVIKDGGQNDADGEANGHVVDPGGISVDNDALLIPYYTLLTAPTPEFANLVSTAKIIVTSSDGENFFDVARYVDEVSVVGQTFLISGSSDIDEFMVMPGVKYDLTNLKGSVDKLYMSGPLEEYADSILLDEDTGMMQLSRLTDIGHEVVQFIATNVASDLVIFTDGAISTALIKEAILDGSSLLELTLDTTLSTSDAKAATGAQVKHIVLDSDGAGVMGLGPKITQLISGSSGVDKIYVPAGSVVDASNLKASQDEVYLEGDLDDYTLNYNSSSNIVLSRDVLIDDETFTESVTVANGGNVATNDLIIFADQQVTSEALKLQIN